MLATPLDHKHRASVSCLHLQCALISQQSSVLPVVTKQNNQRTLGRRISTPQVCSSGNQCTVHASRPITPPDYKHQVSVSCLLRRSVLILAQLSTKAVVSNQRKQASLSKWVNRQPISAPVADDILKPNNGITHPNLKNEVSVFYLHPRGAL